ncbi:hypothetical protein GCM10029964_009590 [Kibdelosporangium lantanae]
MNMSPRQLAAALGLPAPTEEQATVIAAPAEPALVVAGAGAGKTETMAGRVVWLVANGLVVPERVLGLTFTRKAARQLADRVRARLRRLVGSGVLDRLDPSGTRKMAVITGEPTILTYHAYAGRLVGEHGLRLPVEPNARLLTETASWQLAHRLVSTWVHDLDTDRVPATITRYVLDLAGEMGEHLVEADRLAEYAERVARLIEDAPRGPGRPRSRRRSSRRSSPRNGSGSRCCRWSRRTGSASARTACSTSPTRWRWPHGSPVTTPRSYRGSGSGTGPSCWTSTRTPGTPSAYSSGPCSGGSNP